MEQVDPNLEAIYTPARAGALAGVSGKTIGQWARTGLIRPTAYEGRPLNLYTFLDVAQSVGVQWLRSEGFSYERIHEAIDEAEAEYGKWPLVNAPVGIGRVSKERRQDRGALILRRGGHYVELGQRGGQFTLKPDFFLAVRHTLESGGWIAKQLKLKLLEVDPRRLGGLPTLKGRRWSVPQVAQIAADEEGQHLLRTDYGLRAPEIKEAVRWSEAVAAL